MEVAKAKVVVTQVAAAKEASGEDGTGREAAEPEEVLVNVEDEDGPVVEGAGGARVGSDEPDAGDDCADGLSSKSAFCSFLSYVVTRRKGEEGLQ